MIMKGNKAPDFCLKDQRGNQINAASFLHRRLCLFFLPSMEDLPNQTLVIAFAREYERFQQLGVNLIGIYGGDFAKQSLFIPFPLLFDADHEVCKTYGVWNRKIVFGSERWIIDRCALFINEEGVVYHTVKRLSIDNGVDDILSYVQHRYDKEQWRGLSRRTKERLRRMQHRKSDEGIQSSSTQTSAIKQKQSTMIR